jgi:transcriptional regulator with XRE-family HTH domain
MKGSLFMSMDERLKRIATEKISDDGRPRRPSRDLVAMIIRMGRGLRGWKARTLADFAGVSISTVERAERGEPVRDASLERIGAAIGYEPGDFTRERMRLSPDAAHAALSEDWRHRAVVEVSVLAKQVQLRALSRCHSLMARPSGAFSLSIAASWCARRGSLEVRTSITQRWRAQT